MSRPKILLIEDSSSDIQLLRFAFDQQGIPYDLRVLDDGADALTFIDEYKHGDGTDPCVILLDLHLPKHDGMEILRAATRNGVTARIDVIVLSSSASPAERAEIERLGANLRIKPLTLSEFRELGAEVFALCRGEQSAVTISS